MKKKYVVLMNKEDELNQHTADDNHGGKVKIDHQYRIHQIVATYVTVVSEQFDISAKDVQVGPIVLNLIQPLMNWDRGQIEKNFNYRVGNIGTLNASGLFVLDSFKQFPGGSLIYDKFTKALDDAVIPWTYSL